MCGIVLTHNLLDAYTAANRLDNRGQDTTGITCAMNGELYTVRWLGRARTFNIDDLEGLFKSYFGIDRYTNALFVSQARYKTSGQTDLEEVIKAAHPICLDGTREYKQKIKSENLTTHIITTGGKKTIVHNGNIPNHEELLEFIRRNGYELKTDIDTEGLLCYTDMRGVERTLNDIPGTYSFISLDAGKGKATIARDSYGTRPLIYGVKDSKAVFASETDTIRRFGGEIIREVNPGEVFEVDENGEADSKQVLEPKKRLCIFEYIYISRPESVFDGRLVGFTQENAGKELWKEYKNSPILKPSKNTRITFVPHRPYYTAKKISELSGIEFIPYLYKIREVRAFLELTQSEREKSIRDNLFFNPLFISDIKGKRVILIDDSIVRGTNIPIAIELLREYGAAEVDVLVGSNMIGGKINGKEAVCNKGVAMSDPKAFITSRCGRDTEAIRKDIGANFLGYLFEDGMLRSAGLDYGNSCLTCFNGEEFLPRFDLK